MASTLRVAELNWSSDLAKWLDHSPSVDDKPLGFLKSCDFARRHAALLNSSAFFVSQYQNKVERLHAVQMEKVV